MANNSGAGRFGFGYGNSAGSPVARAPIVQPQGAVQYQQPRVQSQQYRQQAAPVQYQQAGAQYQQYAQQAAPVQYQQPAPRFLSPKGMAILKEFTVDHHWRQRAKQLSPMFDEAGNGAQGLSYQQVKKFYDLAGVEFFGEPLSHILTTDIFERFDFNGDDMLTFIQAFKSLKCNLYEGMHHNGGETIKPVALSTPEQKGYTIIKELARGGQGAALLASHNERGQVVLKTYEKNNPNAGTLEEHIAEMDVLRELQEEGNVMHAYDIFQDNDCVYCVNELMSGGDLEALREKAGKAGIPLTQDYFTNIFKQTLMGLDHIHTHGLMHCDLKEPNVMIKNTDLTNPQVAIIDFGLASVCAGPGEAGGTPGYVPPETNISHIWYPKGDIFALGVAFFQLLADKTPSEKIGKLGVFQEGFNTMEDVVRFTATRPLPWHLVEGKFPGVKSWLAPMCSKEKKPRPRALQLLNLTFFGGDTESLPNAPTTGARATGARVIQATGAQPSSPKVTKQVSFRSKLVSQQTTGGNQPAQARVINQPSAQPALQAYGSAGAYQPAQARVINQPSGTTGQSYQGSVVNPQQMQLSPRARGQISLSASQRFVSPANII